jgi:hypothetical protein
MITELSILEFFGVKPEQEVIQKRAKIVILFIHVFRVFEKPY